MGENAPHPMRHVRPPRTPHYKHKPKGHWQRKLRYFYHRLVRLRGSPEAIARGIASGVFAGWLPLVGMQMLVAILLATLFRGNRVVAAAATWVSNPLTSVPITALNYYIGRLCLGQESTVQMPIRLYVWQDLMDLGVEFTQSLVLGSVILGSLAGIASYWLGVPIIRRIRANRHARRQRKLLDYSK